MPKRISVNQLKLLESHRYILKKLASSSDAKRRTILANAPNQLFKVFEIIFKLIENGQLDLTPHQKNRVKKYNKYIKSTQDLKTSAIRRKLRSQGGGFIGGLLGAVLPTIFSLFK